MADKRVDVATFAKDCLPLIDEVQRDRIAVTITVAGNDVAVLESMHEGAERSIIGAMNGTVLRYDDPTGPL